MAAISAAIVISEYAKVHSSYSAYQQNAESYRRTTQEEIAQSCYGRDSPGFRDCIANKLETYYRDQATNEDLQAQQNMAFWAAAIFYLGIVQALIGLAGIYYVARNLSQTAESVQLANKAIVVENRPWVYLNPASISDLMIDDRGAHCSLTIQIANAGNSPAQRVHVLTKAISFGADDPAGDMDKWAKTAAARHKEASWDRTLFTGVQMAVNVPAAMSQQMVLADLAASGSKFISPVFAIGVFYTSDVDDDVHYTTSLHVLGVKNKLGGQSAIPYRLGIVEGKDITVESYSGLIKAT